MEQECSDIMKSFFKNLRKKEPKRNNTSENQNYEKNRRNTLPFTITCINDDIFSFATGTGLEITDTYPRDGAKECSW